MSPSTTPSPACRSVFRESTEATTTEKYTQIWISLINQIERNQELLAGVR